MPSGISFNNSALPVLKSTLLSFEDMIVSFTFKPSGAIIYLFSLSSYWINAILDDLFGSYSIEVTLPAILNLFLLKSISLYLLLCPPPLLLDVIRPRLFLPPVFFRGFVKLLSGRFLVISSNEDTDIYLLLGVSGFSFLIAIKILHQLNLTYRLCAM